MQIFRRRPLALAMCMLALSVCLARQLGAVQSRSLLLFLVPATLAVLFLLLFGRTSWRLLTPFLCLLGITVGLFSSHLFYQNRYQPIQELVDSPCSVEGRVIERTDSGAYYAYFLVEVDRINGEEVSFRAMLECAYPATLLSGDCFEGTVTPRAFTNEGGYDEERFHLAQGCFAVLVSEEEKDLFVIGERQTLSTLLAAQNLRLAVRLESALSDRTGIAPALLLGNKSFLSADVALAFERIGVSHLLALSGLHVSVLIAFLELLLRGLMLPKRGRAILIPLAALFYLGLTGCSVSAFRAVLMVCVMYFGFLAERRYDSFTALCTVLGLLLAATPYAALDLSLWLSFLAAASIIVFSPFLSHIKERWQMRGKIPRFLIKPLYAVLAAAFVGCIANFGLLLLLARSYGTVSLLAVPATLLLSVPTTMLLILSCGVLLFPNLTPLTAICSFLTDLMADASIALSRGLRSILIPVNDEFSQFFLLLLTITFVLLAVLRVRRWQWGLLLPAFALFAVCASFAVTQVAFAGSEAVELRPTRGELTLYATQGEAAAVLTSIGTAGDAYRLSNELRNLRCCELESLIIPRYYNKITYFLAEIATRTRVHTLYLPEPQDEREAAIAERIEQEAALHGVRVEYLSRGSSYAYLYPGEADKKVVFSVSE